MSTLEQLEAEAHDLYPYPTEIDQLCRQVHVRARTVSADRIDAAARTYFDFERDVLDEWAATTQFKDLYHEQASQYRCHAMKAFRAAGLYVEEEA